MTSPDNSSSSTHPTEVRVGPSADGVPPAASASRIERLSDPQFLSDIAPSMNAGELTDLTTLLYESGADQGHLKTAWDSWALSEPDVVRQTTDDGSQAYLTDDGDERIEHIRFPLPPAEDPEVSMSSGPGVDVDAVTERAARAVVESAEIHADEHETALAALSAELVDADSDFTHEEALTGMVRGSLGDDAAAGYLRDTLGADLVNDIDSWVKASQDLGAAEDAGQTVRPDEYEGLDDEARRIADAVAGALDSSGALTATTSASPSTTAGLFPHSISSQLATGTERSGSAMDSANAPQSPEHGTDAGPAT